MDKEINLRWNEQSDKLTLTMEHNQKTRDHRKQFERNCSTTELTTSTSYVDMDRKSNLTFLSVYFTDIREKTECYYVIEKPSKNQGRY